jgi:energy-coupling factor transporter ATP-binding protein EcfA2
MNKWHNLRINLFGNIVNLLNLGHINIICGKNNSGKSTILKTLCNLKNLNTKYSMGVKLENAIIQSLDYSVGIPEHIEDGQGGADVKWVGGYEPGAAEHLNAGKDCLLLLSQKKKDEIYTNFDFEKIKKHILEEPDVLLSLPVEDMGDGHQQHNFSGVRAVFQSYCETLTGEIKTLFIDTQREIASSQSLSVLDGVLKDLFFAKNSNIKNAALYAKYEQLEQAFFAISGGYSFNINMRKKDQDSEVVLLFSKDNGFWYEANESGLGLRALLLLLYSSILSEEDIILIDEPESYLHPFWQRELLKYFKNSNKQFFISTHSNIFLDEAYVDRIFQTKYINSKIEVTDIADKSLALSELGYLSIDNLSGDLLILVEGKTDVCVLQEFFKILDLWGKYDIKILGCGGVPNMESIPFSEFQKDYGTVLVLMDGDWVVPNTGLDQCKQKIEHECNRLGIYFQALQGFGIENYFSLTAIHGFNKNVSPQEVDTTGKLKLDLKISSLKKTVNNFKGISALMTKQDVETSGDLYIFLQKVIEVCSKIPKL